MPIFQTYLDMATNEVRNVRVQNLGTAPGSPVAGQIYFDTALDVLRVFDGTDWVDLGEGGGAGTVTDVTATAPIESTGGTEPDISILPASGSTAGSMSSADFTKLGGVEAGATANETDAHLLDRANHTGTQAIGTVSGLQSALDDKVDTADVGEPNGVASLDANGTVPAAQIPALAIGETFIAANEAAMLALDAHIGDVAIRTDTDTRWLLVDDDPTEVDSWHELVYADGFIESIIAGDRIETSGTTNVTVSVAAEVVSKYAETIGNGSATTFNIDHDLNTFDVGVEVYDTNGDRETVYTEVERLTVDRVRVSFAVAPSTDEFRVVVWG